MEDVFAARGERVPLKPLTAVTGASSTFSLKISMAIAAGCGGPPVSDEMRIVTSACALEAIDAPARTAAPPSSCCCRWKGARAGRLPRTPIPLAMSFSASDYTTSYPSFSINGTSNPPITRMIANLRAVLDEGWDAVFIGSGAPKGKELELPGRHESDRIHIGIGWLQSIAFGHIDHIQPRVLVIGVGNTAMDCCRSAKRLGATEVRVIARRSRPHFKASPWELEDAEEEGVIIVENHAPRRFVIDDGVLTGMAFDVVEWSEGADGRAESRTLDTVVIPCDAVILAIGQEAAFPWIEHDIGVDVDRWGAPVVDKNTFQTTLPGVFVGGDAAWGPENIIWAVEHGHQAAISIHQYLQGQPIAERPAWGMNLVSQKMGLHEWSYGNDYEAQARARMRHVALTERLRNLEVEVELGFDFDQTLKEAGRCLNCDVQTHFTDALCIECDACVDVCPVNCLTIAPDGEEDELRQRLTVPALNLRQPLFVSGPLPQTKRVMVKDEDICIHCGLCAERCPTAAWDMRRSDILVPYAGLPPGAHHRPRGRSLPILTNVTIFPAPPAPAPVPAGAA